MTNREKIQEIGERLLSGISQGVVEQGLPATLGTAFTVLGPKGLRRLAYGKLPVGTPEEQQRRIYDLAKKLDIAFNKELKGKSPENIDIILGSKVTPGYIPKKKKEVAKVILPLNAPTETIAHEFGHAWPKTPSGKVLRKAGLIASKPYIRAVPAIIASLNALDKEDNGLASTIAKTAPYIGAAQLATILANESAANIRGAKLLELAGKKLPISKKIRMFLPTTSYLGHAATLIGLPYGIKKGIEAYRKAKEQGQKIQLKELMQATPEQLASLPTYEEFKRKWGDKLKEMR